MSADNWTNCPGCYRKAVAARNKRVEALNSVYGKVTREEWQAMAESVPEVPHRLEFTTLREDYEITGAERGVLDFSYSASCHICGIQLNIMHDLHRFPGFEEKP